MGSLKKYRVPRAPSEFLATMMPPQSEIHWRVKTICRANTRAWLSTWFLAVFSARKPFQTKMAPSTGRRIKAIINRNLTCRDRARRFLGLEAIWLSRDRAGPVGRRWVARHRRGRGHGAGSVPLAGAEAWSRSQAAGPADGPGAN